MVVRRLAAPTLVLHDPRAGLRISQGPIEDSAFEQFVENILESNGEVAPAPAGIDTADSVEHLADGDGGDPMTPVSDGIQKGGDPGLGPWSYHFGNGTLAKRPRERRGHSFLRENGSGF